MFRPTFYYKNSEIRAGGILFYRCNSKNEVDVLLSKKNDRFEDIGGKTDAIDDSIFDTISREVHEETNGLFGRKQIVKQLYQHRDNGIVHGKYLLFIIKANSFEKKMDTKAFGDHEILYHMPRTMHWVPLESLLHLNIHPRLFHQQ